MCGICGFVTTEETPNEQSLLEAMNARLAHRGPDDGGVWRARYERVAVGLGARRLAVIDLSPQGHMPMSSSDGALHIVYNGEVYNFTELRQELAALGHTFRSATDTEVVLNAYLQWGTDCLQRLNGMFAFGVWDERDRSLFVARDRLGVKPLHYVSWGNNFAFASEIKSLLVHPLVPREINWDALDLYLTFRVVPHPHTIFKSIRKLAAGHFLILKDGRLSESSYWDVFGAKQNGKEGFHPSANGSGNSARWGQGNSAAARRELYELVEDSVRRRLVSDVPLGVLLSGGIDSTIIASIANGMTGSRLKTFTLGFLDRKTGVSVYDESEVAKQTAGLLGTDHHELLLTAGAMCKSIPEVLDHFDEPFGSSSAIPMYHISKLARESVTVALSGDGPDEIFAGYRAYLLESVAKLYTRVPRFLRKGLLEPIIVGLRSSDSNHFSRNVRRAHRFLRSFEGAPAERFFRLTNKFNDVPRESIYRKDYGSFSSELSRQLFAQYYDEPALNQDPINRMLYVDSKIKLADHILTKVDLMSMKASLEVRSPFLDYRVVELAFRIPGSVKLNWFRKKHFLREAFREVLPRSLYNLPKRGFEIPVSHWLKNELRETFLDTVKAPVGGGLLNEDMIQELYKEHCEGRRDHGDKLWILFVLRWWGRKNNLKI